MRIKGTAGLIEIDAGRKAILKRLKTEPGVRVTIEAVIIGPYGKFDGIGQEFDLEILSVREALQ